MTDNSNNPGWVTASGETEKTTSNLANNETNFMPDAGGGRNYRTLDGSGLVQGDKPREVMLMPSDDESGGIMTTARTVSGSPIMNRAPNGQDLIKYQGMPIQLNNAAALGFVTRNADGTFSDNPTQKKLNDPSAKVTDKAPAEKAETNETAGVSFGEAGDAAMQELITSQNHGDMFKMVDSVLNTGGMDEATLGRMASMAGVEPDEMAEKVTTVWAGAQEAAAEFFYDAGVDNEQAFEAFLGSNPQMQANMSEAMRNYFVHHKTEGLQTMSDAYLPQMDRYETERVKDMLAEAGYGFEDDDKGGVRVLVSGTSVSWEVAVKQDIITFSRHTA